ncbi:MAG: KEOPS complex kinase/ATPase Bud32 [Promethearchaeia archaeon]
MKPINDAEMNSSIRRMDLISMGAEAYLYEGSWFERHVIFKHRISKQYRLKELDDKIRIKRTLNEARALIKIKKYGVNVPQVFEIDTVNMTIVMQFIEGEKLRSVLDTLSREQKDTYFKKLGNFIAILHQNGHIHGDITTSNVIITPQEEIFLVDFGLHEYSDSIEDKSVDLHLLKRVLLSSHATHFKQCFPPFLNGYREMYKNFDERKAEHIIRNISAIESRGRYVKKEERL